MARVFVDFSTPAAGFDQPLELWSACHDRVRRMVGLLQRLDEHLHKSGVDDSARVTATSIRRYFDEAAPRHHEDEEIDLFPLVRRRAAEKADAAESERLAQVIAALESDHAELHAMWSALRQALAQIEAGRPGPLDGALVALFAGRFLDHAEREDTQVAPAFRRLLTKADLAAVGQAMAKRRGVDWSELAAQR